MTIIWTIAVLSVLGLVLAVILYFVAEKFKVEEDPRIDDVEKVLPGDDNIIRRTVINSLAFEGIVGHMTTNPIHSIEAGLILVSDGCDMTKGRARITLESNNSPKEGDIHKYSASAIERVKILPGSEKPVHIEVYMNSLVGFFQVEEVLIPKIHASTIHQYIELYAGVIGEEMKRYM